MHKSKDSQIAEAHQLTIKEKMDSVTLLTPHQEGAEGDQDYVAPGTATEREICRIWAEVLGIERVGVHDDFFDLGGHSLLAASIGSHIRDIFEVELKLEVFFEDRTIAALAERIETLAGLRKSERTESEICRDDGEEFGEI
jgi:acyl carrier protein